MARTVIAIFESVYTAKQAIGELLDMGYPRERIDLVIDRMQDYGDMTSRPEAVRSEKVADELQAGAGIGAGIGSSIGLMGSLLFWLGALHLPQLSTVSAPLAAIINGLILTACGAAAGGLAGSLLGGLLGLGIPEEEIRAYAKNVRKHAVALMVMADWDAVDGTIEVLGHHNPMEIQQKTIEWQKASPRERKLAERALHVKISEQNRPH